MQTNFDTIVREVVYPEIMETVFMKRIEWLESLFSKDTSKQGGSKITVPIQTSISTNASTYTRADVDPVSDNAVWVDATWNKVYQHVSAEVHGIDISQAAAGGQPSLVSLAQQAMKEAMDSLFDMIYDDIWTQVTSDIDSNNTYSDAALNRTTYPTLASDEDTTDTAITLQLLRDQANACLLNKNSGDKSDFMWVMESAVFNKFEPLVGALHSWVVNDPGAGQQYAAGFQVPGSFEGTRVVSPKGMTTGQVFFLRPRDLRIKYHRDVEIEKVPSGRDSMKWVIRCGVNGFYLNPGFAGKQVDKD